MVSMDWTTERSEFDPQQREKDSLLASVSKSVLVPTQRSLERSKHENDNIKNDLEVI
jgi:hypothetical protein